MSHPSRGVAETGICDIVSYSTEICYSGTDTSYSNRFYYAVTYIIEIPLHVTLSNHSTQFND